MYILHKENVERRTDSEVKKEALLRQGFLLYEPPADPPVELPKDDEPPKGPPANLPVEPPVDPPKPKK